MWALSCYGSFINEDTKEESHRKPPPRTLQYSKPFLNGGGDLMGSQLRFNAAQNWYSDAEAIQFLATHWNEHNFELQSKLKKNIGNVSSCASTYNEIVIKQKT